MSFDLTRGEIMLVAFILGLVYISGLLPKIAARLAGKEDSGSSKGPHVPAGTDQGE